MGAVLCIFTRSFLLYSCLDLKNRKLIGCQKPITSRYLEPTSKQNWETWQWCREPLNNSDLWCSYLRIRCSHSMQKRNQVLAWGSRKDSDSLCALRKTYISWSWSRSDSFHNPNKKPKDPCSTFWNWDWWHWKQTRLSELWLGIHVIQLSPVSKEYPFEQVC